MVSLLVQHPDRADRKDYTMGYLFGQEGNQRLLGYKTKGAHKETPIHPLSNSAGMQTLERDVSPPWAP